MTEIIILSVKCHNKKIIEINYYLTGKKKFNWWKFLTKILSVDKFEDFKLIYLS